MKKPVSSAKKVASNPSDLPETPEEKQSRLQLLDYAAELRWASLFADPTGSLREKDPELVDALSFSLKCRSVGDDPRDKECGLLILERIRGGTPKEINDMFAIIKRMKKHAAIKGAKTRRASVIMPLWRPFLTSYMQKHGVAPTLNEFANHLIETTEGTAIKFPSPSCEPAWTPIWKAAGLSHRVTRPGKGK